ncbi:MAG: hypothetical protein RI885_2040 [Actinomycetota bacterium]|jgi:hypothetical protein
MRVSEFWQAVADEFGEPYGRLVTTDLVLREFGDLTAAGAIAAGHDVKQVWLALCSATDVPAIRRHGVGIAPRR